MMRKLKLACGRQQCDSIGIAEHDLVGIFTEGLGADITDQQGDLFAFTLGGQQGAEIIKAAAFCSKSNADRRWLQAGNGGENIRILDPSNVM
jgi:hypothetical protein